MTTLQTFKAFINGKLVNVDQLHGNRGRQNILYRIQTSSYEDGGWKVIFPETLLSADEFWKLNPIKKD